MNVTVAFMRVSMRMAVGMSMRMRMTVFGVAEAGMGVGTHEVLFYAMAQKGTLVDERRGDKALLGPQSLPESDWARAKWIVGQFDTTSLRSD
jgi:type III secretory pathway component EscT